MKTLAAALLLVGACALLAIIYEPAPAPRGAAVQATAPLGVSVAWNGEGVGCETVAGNCTRAALPDARGR